MNNPLEEDVVLKLAALEKTFEQGGRKLQIFKNLSLKVEKGEIVALVGQSGTGKSTLLQIAGLLDKASAGEVIIDKKSTQSMNDRQRTTLRNEDIGFVYQFHHLLPEFDAVENVAMPMIIGGHNRSEAKDRAAEMLRDLGLAERLDHRPARLSGGEQQRIAIARAVLKDAPLLILDEATSAQDYESEFHIQQAMAVIVKNRTTIVVAHRLSTVEHADRIIVLQQGKVDAMGKHAELLQQGGLYARLYQQGLPLE